MKDNRPRAQATSIARLAGATPGSSADDAARAGRRSKRRRIAIVVGLIAAALAVVIGPHLIDDTRVSSVADQAAHEAGGVAPLDQSACPASLRNQVPSGVHTVPPVAFTSAVICRYRGGLSHPDRLAAVVPAAQLAELNADFRQGSGHGHPPGIRPGYVSVLQTQIWWLVGQTVTGDRVTLVGRGEAPVYSWLVAPQASVWRPTAVVQQMLADDLPR